MIILSALTAMAGQALCKVQARWHVRGMGHPGTQRIYTCT